MIIDGFTGKYACLNNKLDNSSNASDSTSSLSDDDVPELVDKLYNESKKTSGEYVCTLNKGLLCDELKEKESMAKYDNKKYSGYYDDLGPTGPTDGTKPSYFKIKKLIDKFENKIKN